jgi:hypothetical protein
MTFVWVFLLTVAGGTVLLCLLIRIVASGPVRRYLERKAIRLHEKHRE